MDEVISIKEVKSPHHRDLSIAGFKPRTPNDQTEILASPDLRDRGIHFADSLAVLANCDQELERDIESEVMDGWIKVLQVLINLKKCHRSLTVDSPDPIASDTGVSRIINFSGIASVLRWTKPRCEKALSIHDDPTNSPDCIASQLGCTLQKLTNFLSDPDPDI
jgi:hypothetical protein